jgi:parallel beta-helix repeat protein
MIFVICSSVFFVYSIQFGAAQASTEFSGLINSDLTWTKGAAPFILTGSVTISNGATLTIQPGVSVILGSYNFLVNGTLRALGSVAEPIRFTGSSAVTFTSFSTAWNEQTRTGSIIENAVMTGTPIVIETASPKINNNTFSGGASVIINHGAPVISNNTVSGLTFGAGIGGNYVDSALITGNNISGWQIGVQLFAFGTSVVNGNIISSNGQGVLIYSQATSGSGRPTIQDNTITNNTNGISFSITGTNTVNPIITGNNIYSNIFNVYSSVSSNINASNNWWGTTDQATINQTIYDSKTNSSLGKVEFTPFLTTPSPTAPEVPGTSPSPSPSATPVPTQTPTTTGSPVTTPSTTSSSTTNPSQTPVSTTTNTPSTTQQSTPTSSSSPGNVSPSNNGSSAQTIPTEILYGIVVLATIIIVVIIAAALILRGRKPKIA